MPTTTRGLSLFTMKAHPLIEIDPAKAHGRPVIRGTRVPVSILVGSVAGGMTPADTAVQYDVTEEQVQAALLYAAELIERERHYPLAG